MAWSDRYLPASFRGVGFHVQAHENAGGRRIQTHEYPGRDEPFSEDLGRRARQFSVEAYIVGDDYMERRDALLDACEREGPGLLAHPYRGRREVACERYRLTERLSEGRMCRVTLEFVEAGRNAFPRAQADTASAVDAAAGAANTALAAAFANRFAFPRAPASFVSEQLLETANELSKQLGIAEAFSAADVFRPGEISGRVLSAVRQADIGRLEGIARRGLAELGIAR